MLSGLVQALVQSKNEAADDVLSEALGLGTEPEKTIALGALLARGTLRGLAGVVRQYASLPAPLQQTVIENIGSLHSALRYCARSEDRDLAVAGVRLIASARQGKLAYVISEVLNRTDAELSAAAVESLTALAQSVYEDTISLQESGAETAESLRQVWHRLADHRADIEQAVARGVEVHRGRHGLELLRAALLLADWPASRTFLILQTQRHAAQSPMVRRLQQPPEPAHVPAFLLAASHANLRSHFGAVFSRIEDPAVLDAVLRKTHWLKDQRLQLCMHQVNRGAWWGEAQLAADLARRPARQWGQIAEWLAASGMHELVQDERLGAMCDRAEADLGVRLSLLRVAMRRPRGAAVGLLRRLLRDPDERIKRMAAREIVRRRPADCETILLKLMAGAPPSVRRIIGRSLGQVGFEHFWQRFDRLDPATRKAAGKAMLKLLPDAPQRLVRRLTGGPVEHRVKAIQIAVELGLLEEVAPVLMEMCSDASARVRSKAVVALGELPQVPSEAILDRALHDSDARVRANAIEVLETKNRDQYVPLLASRTRSADGRERANAIKALHSMKVGTAWAQLTAMLRDERPAHRVSALWALRQIGWWQMLDEVGKLARRDPNPRVRRYAMAMLRALAESPAQPQNAGAG